MTQDVTKDFVSNFWDTAVMPTLKQYVSIPCKSQSFDANWQQSGFFDEAINLLTQWMRAQNLPGLQVETVRLENYAPCVYAEIPGHTGKTVMFYGHLDKMPEATGWREDLDPWKPVVEGDKLYGRGSVDNGYSLFSAITAIKCLQAQNLPHDRYVIVLECAEESGSIGFPHYLEYLKDRIDNPSLIVVLDAGGSDYERLWLTASLRGLLLGRLRVDLLKNSIHSGVGGGAVASTFRIARQLLNRIEDMYTGDILIKSANVEIPDDRTEQAKFMAKVLGDRIYEDFPMLEGCKLMHDVGHEVLLSRSWRPSLSVIGADGLPTLENAGNALRPFTTLMLGMRLPPCCEAQKVIQDLKQTLENEPPYGAKVSFTPTAAVDGWAAPKMRASMEI